MTAFRNEYVGAAGVRVVARDIARVPVELQARLRPKIRAAGMEVLQAAAVNASWSSRIPGAMSLRSAFKDGSPGVTIRVDTTKAPHARPYEGIVKDSFRHPVFGDRSNWVSQAARPYLLPAARAGYAVVAAAIGDAVDEALTAAGFR